MGKTIINTGFFRGSLFLAGTNTQRVNEVLCKWIEDLEPEFLYRSLGYELGKALLAGIFDESGEAIADANVPQKWKDLVFGAEFTYGTQTIKWQGLKQPDYNTSVIANYVYYHYYKDLHTQSTTSGEVKNKKENSAKVSVGNKICEAWNEMRDVLGVMWLFLTHKKDDNGDLVYPEFKNANIDYTYFDYQNTFGI